MELVEGEELRCPVPLETALRYARQIAEALEAAHEKGIVHRDLKPGNIRVTRDGVVKLLDFGLAKAVEDPGPEPPAPTSQSPTLSLAMTEAGLILGTAAYMAPEQVRGKPVDKRADIWAFGVVLYEMLCGYGAFQSGDTVADILAAVVTRDPDWTKLPADTPGHIRQLLVRCLRKDPKQRLRDIGEARIAIEEPPPAVPIKQSRRLPYWAVALIAVPALLISWVNRRADGVEDRALVRFSVDLGPKAIPGDRTVVSLARDGKRIAFLVEGPNGSAQLATRSLDQKEATLLPGTDGAVDPFFSPDGQWVGFFAAGYMKKVPVQGGTPITLSNFGNTRGAAWAEDGRIIVAVSPASGLATVPDTGGSPEDLTDPSKDGFRSHRWPQILPGGRQVLFTAAKGGGRFDAAELAILDLQTKNWKRIHHGGYFARYLPTGHIIYVQQGTLFGVRFNSKELKVVGSPVRLLDDVAADETTAAGRFDFDQSGTLVYFSGRAQTTTYPVVSLEQSGKATSY